MDIPFIGILSGKDGILLLHLRKYRFLFLPDALLKADFNAGFGSAGNLGNRNPGKGNRLV